MAGLVSAPATESIMGALPPEKAGVGSAVNDTHGNSAGHWALQSSEACSLRIAGDSVGAGVEWLVRPVRWPVRRPTAP